MSKKKEEVITLCAIWYNEERERASETKNYVPVGTNSISFETVRRRVKRKNVTAYNQYETPLITDSNQLFAIFASDLEKWDSL